MLFTILLGIIYPLTITGVSQLAFPVQANGNLIKENGKIVGSQLIGQNFSSPAYFHGRPSVIDYNSNTSSGSNLGPTNQKLIDNITQRIQLVKAEDTCRPGFGICQWTGRLYLCELRTNPSSQNCPGQGDKQI
jgi:potassium-transporting ATPase KdpC subunit